MRTQIHMLAALILIIPTSSTVALVSRKTFVKFANNTPFDITVKNFSTEFDTTLDKNQFGADQAGVVIRSGTTEKKIVFFERNVDIKKGKEYKFELGLEVPIIGDLILEQKIIGKNINSQMYLSASSGYDSTAQTRVSRQWKEASHKRSSITLSNGSHTFIISFNAYSDGPGTDDVWYAIDYIDENMYKVDPVGNNGLNVLIYNVAGLLGLPDATRLLGLPRFQLGQSARAKIIPVEIAHKYDSVIICEAFAKQTREPLMDGLKKNGYPYISNVVGLEKANKLGKVIGAVAGAVAGPLGYLVGSRTTEDIRSGGVLIASKWPIVAQKSLVFDDCIGVDCNMNKGAAYVAINKNGKKYHIIGLHTNAQWKKDDTTHTIRHKQFKQLAEFIKNENIPSNEPLIIGGDLNVDAYNQDEYNGMLKTLRAIHPPLDGQYKYTWDPALNKLEPQEDLNIKELLDYILYSKDHLKPTKSFNRVLLFKAHKDWADDMKKLDLPGQTTLFDLSDHFPVYGHFVFDQY